MTSLSHVPASSTPLLFNIQVLDPKFIIFSEESSLVLLDYTIITKIKILKRKFSNISSWLANKMFLDPNLPSFSDKSAIFLVNRVIIIISRFDKFIFRPLVLYIFIIHKSTLIVKWLYLKKKRTKIFYFHLVSVFFPILALKYPGYPFLTLNLNGNIKVPMFFGLTILYDVICHTFKKYKYKYKIKIKVK
jgi:hypothetical protein